MANTFINILEANSPCDTDNGKCGHICIWRGTGSEVECDCISPATLASDKMACENGNRKNVPNYIDYMNYEIIISI